jgi:hypothetical protein
MLFGASEDDEDNEGCDGNCEQCKSHGEMPAEVKEFFDKLFGGVK